MQFTVHSVAGHEVLVLLVDRGRRSGERADVVVQIPAQVLIKHCGQQMEFFVIVSLCGKMETKRKKRLMGFFNIFNIVSKKMLEPTLAIYGHRRVYTLNKFSQFIATPGGKLTAIIRLLEF